MFCVKCGQQLPDDSEYCFRCGTIFVSEPTPPSVPPVQTPAYGTPEVAQSTCNDYPVYPVQGEFPDPVPQPKKKGSKKLILLITACVLAFALIAAGVFFVLAYTSPEAKLGRALSGSGEQLKEITANAGTVYEMIENVSALKDGRTIAFSLQQENGMEGYYSSETKLMLQLDQDLVGKEMLLSAEVRSEASYAEMPEFNYEEEISLAAYANEDTLMVSMPGMLDEYYSVPLDQLGEKLYDSALGEMIMEELPEKTVELIRKLDIDLFASEKIKSYQEACPEEYEAFLATVILEKSDKEIPNGSGYDTVYYITWDMEALIDLYKAYAEVNREQILGADAEIEELDSEDLAQEVFDTLEKAEVDLYFGITDGCLTAVHGDFTYEDESHTLTVLLLGTENVWEDMVLYADDEEVISGGITSTASGFELSLIAEGEELLIICDDAGRELTVKLEGEELFTLGYSAGNKGCSITYEIEEEDTYFASNVLLTVEIRPLEKIRKPESAIDLLGLDKDELMELGEKIVAAFGY